MVRLSTAATPADRVNAVIDASFGDAQFEDGVFSVWLALYGNARRSERLRRILMLYHSRLHTNLLYNLRRLMRTVEAERTAEGIAAMVDGLWLRYALTGKPSDPGEPRSLTREYFAQCLERSSRSALGGLRQAS